MQSLAGLQSDFSVMHSGGYAILLYEWSRVIVWLHAQCSRRLAPPATVVLSADLFYRINPPIDACRWISVMWLRAFRERGVKGVAERLHTTGRDKNDPNGVEQREEGVNKWRRDGAQRGGQRVLMAGIS